MRAWPSIKKLVRETGYSNKPIVEGIQQLERISAIVKVPYNKRMELEKPLHKRKAVYQLTGMYSFGDVKGEYLLLDALPPESIESLLSTLKSLSFNPPSGKSVVCEILQSKILESTHEGSTVVKGGTKKKSIFTDNQKAVVGNTPGDEQVIHTDCVHYDDGCKCTQTGFDFLGDCNGCNGYHKTPGDDVDGRRVYCLHHGRQDNTCILGKPSKAYCSDCPGYEPLANGNEDHDRSHWQQYTHTPTMGELYCSKCQSLIGDMRTSGTYYQENEISMFRLCPGCWVDTGGELPKRTTLGAEIDMDSPLTADELQHAADLSFEYGNVIDNIKVPTIMIDNGIKYMADRTQHGDIMQLMIICGCDCGLLKEHDVHTLYSIDGKGSTENIMVCLSCGHITYGREHSSMEKEQQLTSKQAAVLEYMRLVARKSDDTFFDAYKNEWYDLERTFEYVEYSATGGSRRLTTTGRAALQKYQDAQVKPPCPKCSCIGDLVVTCCDECFDSKQTKSSEPEQLEHVGALCEVVDDSPLHNVSKHLPKAKAKKPRKAKAKPKCTKCDKPRKIVENGMCWECNGYPDRAAMIDIIYYRIGWPQTKTMYKAVNMKVATALAEWGVTLKNLDRYVDEMVVVSKAQGWSLTMNALSNESRFLNWLVEDKQMNWGDDTPPCTEPLPEVPGSLSGTQIVKLSEKELSELEELEERARKHLTELPKVE